MIHELLLALMGHTGDVFIDTEEQARVLGSGKRGAISAIGGRPPGVDNEDTGDDGDDLRSKLLDAEHVFQLSPDFTFVGESERLVLNRLVRLGYYYRELNRFTVEGRESRRPIGSRTPVSPSPGAGGRGVGGVYQRALAMGIAEVLKVYSSAILAIEQETLRESVPVLSKVVQAMQEFEILLPPLHALVTQVQERGLQGGKLLNLLHSKCHCGIPSLQACIQRLLWYCHQAMYKQLAAWMVHGLLQDPHNEFFITGQQLGSERSSDGSEYRRPGDREAAFSSAFSSGQECTADWHSGFSVRMDMLPSYISVPVAESILLVGKAVRVLRNPTAAFQNQDMASGVQKWSISRSARQGWDLPPSSACAWSSGNTQGSELLPKEDANKFSTLLRKLQEMPVFNRIAFEKAVDIIRADAARHLWQLVVVHADLHGHLRALKDYFLLAKGDFFQCLLEESRALMRMPPRPNTAEADLKIPFQQAALKTIAEDDKYFSRVCLRLPAQAMPASTSEVRRTSALPERFTTAVREGGGKEKESMFPTYEGWDALMLEYTVEWPLQLLITKDALAKYNQVFQYLLRLKRIQLELEKTWALAMHRDRLDFVARRKNACDGEKRNEQQFQRMSMWQLRQHMTYLITNLQFYIQVDVIESQSKLLQERIEASKDFTELTRFHQEYLSALISQSFLDTGSISRILDLIIKLCWQLCNMIEASDATPDIVEIEALAKTFRQRSISLFTILSSSKLSGSQRAPFLRQFLLRLNYNNYFHNQAHKQISRAPATPLRTAAMRPPTLGEVHSMPSIIL